MADYLPIVLLFGVATLFVFGSFVASSLLGPTRRESAAKIGPYECGIVPDHEPAERFPVKFYLVAMIFIIFDIEVIFLYPWAVMFGQLGLFGLMEMVLFSVSVVVAFTYLISNGALDWAPVAQLRSTEIAIAGARSSASTIRRVSRSETVVPALITPFVDSVPAVAASGQAA
jgi:NADH-quinone oxidoreductase subunit A